MNMTTLERLLKDPRFLTEMFEVMRDGLMVLDNKGIILLFNRAAEEITGYRREDVMGKECSVFHCDACMVVDKSNGNSNTQLEKSGAVYNRKCRIETASGKTAILLKNAVILHDEAGEILGTVESMTDITSLYNKEMELQELKEELRQDYWFMGLLGKSIPMQRLYEHIRNAASSDAPVLICGESGT